MMATPSPEASPLPTTDSSLAVPLAPALLAQSQPAAPSRGVADPWITLEEGAQHAGVSKDTIRSWVDAGVLPHGRINRVLRVRRSDIDRAMLRGAEAPREDAVNERVDTVLASLGAPRRPA